MAYGLSVTFIWVKIPLVGANSGFFIFFVEARAGDFMSAMTGMEDTLGPHFGLLAFLLFKNRLPSSLDRTYLPMGNCCDSAATVPSELRRSARAQLQPSIERESSLPSSSRPTSRPRSHSSASKRESTRHSGMSSQDPIPRSRTKSAPQPPQTFKSSTPQDARPRAHSVHQSERTSRSDSRPTSPGETYKKRAMNFQ